MHRDVKPGNILISQEYGEERAYLTDFGLTKKSATEARLTRTGFMVGTLDYVAPEQAKGETVDGRADTYALACVLFVALTGKVPFDRDSDVAKLFAHLNDPPPSATEICPEVPQELDEVIRRGMAKRPHDRYGSSGELARAARGATTVAAPVAPSGTEIKPAALSRTEVTRERAAGPPREGLPPREGPPQREAVPGRGTRLAAAIKSHRLAATVVGVAVVAVAVAIALIAGGGGSHPATTQASSTVPPASVTASGQAATTVATPSSQASIYHAQVESITPRLSVIFEHFPVANDFGKRAFSQASLAVAGRLRGVADNLDALSPPPSVLTDHEALVTHLREMEQAWRSLATDSDNRDFTAARNDLQKVKTTLAQINASVRRVEATR